MPGRLVRQPRFAGWLFSAVETKPPSFGSIHLNNQAVLHHKDNLAVAQAPQCLTNSIERLVVQGNPIATRGCGSHVHF